MKSTFTWAKKLFALASVALIGSSGISHAQVAATCTPTFSYGCGAGDNISNVSLTGATVNLNYPNTLCATNAYQNLVGATGVNVPDLIPGSTYTGSVSTTYGGTYEYPAVWIDYNDDGVFQTTELIASATTGIGNGNPFTFSVVVPASATPGNKRMRVVLNYGSANSLPCVSSTFGEVHDYRVTVLSLSPCTNPPTAGTTTAVDSICPNTAFSLSSPGVSYGTGMVYQWQTAPVAAGPWTDIAGATTSSYTVAAGITTATSYRLKVVCNTGAAVFSAAKTVNMKSFMSCYCSPVVSYGCSNGAHISSFSTTGAAVNVTNNGTGCANGTTGYSSYLGQVVSAIQSSTFSVSVTVGSYSGGVKIWADWNQDGIFDPTTELLAASTSTINSGSTFTATVSVPLNATPGTTVMRVRVVEGSTAYTPCSTGGYGETEDYGFNVVQVLPCTNPPSAGVVNGVDSICPNISFSLGSTGVTLASAMTYQWQSAPVAAGPWTDIPGAIAPNYTSTGITVATSYRLKVICSAGTPVFSAAKTVSIKSFLDCYCTPTYNYGCSNGCTINSFSTAGGASNITNLNTGCANSTTGYSNYMGMTVAGMQTTTFNYTVGISNYGGGVKIWADWNHDGVFDPVTELVGASTATIPSGGTFTGTATIPATALSGSTRLRVRAVESSTVFDPCSIYFYGETEDYTMLVIPITPCTNPPNGGTVTGIDSICAGLPFALMASNTSLGSGLVYQWQTAPAATGPWTDIVGANTLSYNNAAGITAATYYRVRSVCNSGSPVYTTVKAVLIKTPVNCPCAAIATYGCTYDTHVNSFSTTNAYVNISNLNTGCASGNAGYSDYANIPSLTITAVQSTTFNVAVNVGSYAGGVKIWADWNQDGTFDPVTELVSASTSTVAGGSTYNGTITVPTTSLLGTTRIRIRAVESSTSFTPCSTINWGETEDYSLTVAPMPDCNNATFPTVATLTPSSANFCAFGNVTFTLVPLMPPASSMEYIWETSNTATGPWTSVGSTIIPTFNLNNVTATAYYRVRLLCHNVEIRTFGAALVTVNNPGSLNVTNAEHCGPAALTLTATPVNPAHTVTWFTSFTGGTSVATGTSFTTPTIGATTIYFAQANGAGLSGCAAQRTPVYAYIRPFPAPQLGPDKDTCVFGAASFTLDPGVMTNSPIYAWSTGSAQSTIDVNQSGTYSVAVTNSFNCVGRDTINVAIKQRPIVDIGSTGTTLCEGDTKTLDAGPGGENGGNYYWNTGDITRQIQVSATGTYIVYVTSSEGCVTSDTVSIVVGGHVPRIDAIVVTAGASNTFTFVASNPEYVISYNWDYGDGTVGTSTTPTSSHQYTANGNYWVKLISASTCAERTDSIMVTIVGLGVSSVNNTIKVKVYPNPTDGQGITLETEGDVIVSEITISNLLGQDVYTNKKLNKNSNKNYLNLSNHLPSGIYNIRMKTNKGDVLRKLEIIK